MRGVQIFFHFGVLWVRRNERKFVTTKQMKSFHPKKGYKYDAIKLHMTTTFDPKHFFDKIYCISVDSREDRRADAKKQFAAIGLLDRVEFILVRKHPENREKGIFQSHILCINKGLQEGGEHILIFEDDILIKKFQPRSLLNAIDYLHRTPSWNSFLLGAISSKITVTDEQSVVKLGYRSLAHAYALNRPFAEHLARKSWDGTPFDELLRQECKDYYALSPMIAFQSDSSTDNQRIILDRVRRLLGGLPFIQRANEFFQRYKRVIVCSHLLLAIAILLLLFRLWAK